MSESILLANIANQLSQKFTLSSTLYLDFAGCIIRVNLNSAKLHEMLNDYYSEFISKETDAKIVVNVYNGAKLDLDVDFTLHERPAGKKPKEEYCDLPDGRVIYKVKTGIIMAFGHGTNFVAGDCVTNDNQVINFINNRFMEYRQQNGAILFHSSAVLNEKRGIAISGIAGAGKSTLALHMMNKGVDFLSNDRVIVDCQKNHLTMTGVAKHPRINPGTILSVPGLGAILNEEDTDYYQAMPDEELWDIEHKYDALIDEIYGPGKFTMNAPLDALVILNWHRTGEETTITEIDINERLELLPTFTKTPGLFYWPVDDNHSTITDDQTYLDMLKNCTVYEISGTVNFAKAVDFLSDYLES